MVNIRNKGAQGERELANLFKTWLGNDFNIERNLEQTRSGGHDLVGLFDFAVEVKRCEKLNVYNWWLQTTQQALKSKLIPMLAYRRNRQKWTFILAINVSMPFFISGYEEIILTKRNKPTINVLSLDEYYMKHYLLTLKYEKENN